MTQNHTMLTSSELSSIWTSYMNDTMSICILSHFLKHAEDEEIRSVIQFSYDLSTTHVEKLTDIFRKEGLPIPTGFTEEQDLNLNAPRLYTDMFILTYINHMAKVGLLAYSSFIAMSARKDIRDYFMEGLKETSDLYDNSSNVLLSKGLFVRAPYVEYPTKTDFVESKKYFNGYALLGNQRPLNTVEISHLFMNVQTNLIGNKLALSFAQTSPNEEVQKWLLRGADISKKHVEIFTKLLLDNDIQAPASSDVSITDSTTPPFSDKLILFHMGLLSGAGAGNYSTAAAASQRNDLMVNYERLSVEIARYAKDGGDIMVRNGWLEEPPGTIDKHKLSKTKNKK
ncbi:Protein of unknown function [Halobacillus dabanensis]|uniref:DUF3231 domain-containing protein n=1 Tax=Halobacillus dabanensis TaxID=240302 RepID=A0A1I3Q840_HALDA|nr:DUF3231 family protein [Halobacillus dabanensis]SFJ29819.1 Protein of unknown function [Halobacillus dabanensis]